MAKGKKKLKSVKYNSFISKLYGLLFSSDFYNEILKKKLSEVILPFLVIFFLAYLVPVYYIYKQIVTIDLLTPQNQLSQEIIDFIDQIPQGEVRNGELILTNEQIYQIYKNSTQDVLVEINKEKKNNSGFQGALLLAFDGIYYHEYKTITFFLNLFDVPFNPAVLNKSQQYNYISYKDLPVFSFSRDIIIDELNILLKEYKQIKNFFKFVVFLTLPTFVEILFKIFIFSIFLGLILGNKQLKLKQNFKLTAAIFMPYVLFEAIDIMFFKQSYLMNVTPYSTIFFIIVNGYFINKAIQIHKVKKHK